MINAKLPRVNGKIPTYINVNVNAASGFIFNPAFTKILCAYPYDGGTAGRTCDPVGVSRECVPGCFQFDREGGGPGWCDEGIYGGTSCAYKPEHLVEMLEAQKAVRLSGGTPTYNEVRASHATTAAGGGYRCLHRSVSRMSR